MTAHLCMRRGHWVYLTVLLLVYINSVQALNCYVCNSTLDDNCNAKFEKTEINPVKPQHCNVYNAKYCIKVYGMWGGFTYTHTSGFTYTHVRLHTHARQASHTHAHQASRAHTRFHTHTHTFLARQPSVKPSNPCQHGKRTLNNDDDDVTSFLQFSFLISDFIISSLVILGLLLQIPFNWIIRHTKALEIEESFSHIETSTLACVIVSIVRSFYMDHNSPLL
uniref:Protein quiver n=1 Tax=Octopus bimaculoides TaxID=37653 RepID=A0A0L8HIU4_OCTBM